MLFRSEEGSVSFLWVDQQNNIKTLEDGSIIMDFVFKTIKPLNNETLDLNGSVTAVAAYDKDYKSHNIVLKPSVINSIYTKDNWQVTPNPAIGGLIHIKMNISDNKTILFRLIDNTGRLILTKKIMP